MAHPDSPRSVAGTEQFLRSNSNGTPSGRRFGTLPILKTLGEGAYGTVHLVLSNEIVPRPMALKTIKATDATAEERESFRLEAGRWVSLGAHPNIITAYDVLTPEGAVGVLCDYVAPDEHGRTSLQDWIEAGALTDELLVRWSLDFCAGMAHAYASGLSAHRDVKPDNLLIDRGALCVADFGLATAARLLAHDATERDLSPAGSRLFMPPEQFILGFRCDQRSDIYAFGVTLYMAVSGGRWPIRPANVDDHEAWMYAHARDAVRPLQHFLWPVVERCLRKRPEQRFATIDGLRDAVQAAGARVGIFVQPRMPSESSTSWEWLKLEHQAHSLALLGYERESMQLYDRAFALHDAPLLWQSKANALLSLGRLEPALECVLTALEKNDDDYASWYIFGDALRRLQQHEQAVMAYEHALAHMHAPEFEGNSAALQQAHDHRRYEVEHIEAKLHHSLSLSLRALGNFTRAQSEIGRAVAMRPQDVVYRQSKAMLYLHVGDSLAALREVDAAQAYAPNDPDLCAIRIHALLHLGRAEEALHAAAHSLELAPQHPRHLFNYAQALSAVHADDVGRVVTAFENALAHAEPGSELHRLIVDQYADYRNDSAA